MRCLASKALAALFTPPGNPEVEVKRIAELSAPAACPLVTETKNRVDKATQRSLAFTRVTSGQASAIEAWIDTAPTTRAAGERAK